MSSNAHAKSDRPWRTWYSHRRWRRIRRAHLQREPLCRHCLDRGIVTPGREVDHIEPHKGDRQKFWSGELQTLCTECHSRKTAEDEGKRVRPAVSVSGEPDGWQ